MKIKLKISKDEKYLEILRMLGNIKHPGEIAPYNKLRNREMEVLAILYYFYNEKHADVPADKRNKHVFSYDSIQEIIDILNERDIKVSKEVVYNIMADLRKKGFIESKNIVKTHLLPNISEIGFKFI